MGTLRKSRMIKLGVGAQKGTGKKDCILELTSFKVDRAPEVTGFEVCPAVKDCSIKIYRSEAAAVKSN